jgi:hypothetical protein
MPQIIGVRPICYAAELLNLKMLSPESEHIEQHIIVKILHTFRRMNLSNMLFGHPILQKT